MKLLSRSEIVVLNPALGMMPAHVMAGFARPLYAAAADGLYVIDRAKFMTSQGPKILGAAFLATFSALFAFAGFLATLFGPPTFNSPPSLNDRIPGLIIMSLGLAGLAFTYKLYSDAKRKAPYEKVIPAELVVPWSQVRTVVIAGVRSVYAGSITNPVFREVGDWHVFTWDGREIVVPEVSDPYNTLEYVKSRFGLRF